MPKATKQQTVRLDNIVNYTDDELGIEATLAVHSMEVSAALVAAGIGDCYLVKDEEGRIVGLFRLNPRLLEVIQQIKDQSLKLNVTDYWDSFSQVTTAQGDVWPHEAINRQ